MNINIEHGIPFIKANFKHNNEIVFYVIYAVKNYGYAFHANKPKQLERDKMKDRILEKYNIPILRLATNESGEEEKLKNKLEKIWY